MKHAFFPALILSFLIPGISVNAQVFATSETDTINTSCNGCNLSNPNHPVDANQNNHAEFDLWTSSHGAYISETLYFPSSGSGGETVGVLIEDPNLQHLDATKLASVTLNTYYNGVSNNDSHNSGQYSIQLLNTSEKKYILQFTTTTAFDAIRFKFSAGVSGAINRIRLYYGFYTSTTLPVELLGFNGISQNNLIRLNWSTASETNNDYFTIEKTTDGVIYEHVAHIDGSGNTIATTNYQVDDHAPREGTSYYRLTQTDYNGVKTTFPHIAVIYAVPENERIIISPHPASFQNVHFTFYATEESYLELIDAQGKTVYSESLGETGKTEKFLPVILDKGVYLIRISSPAKVITEKMVVR